MFLNTFPGLVYIFCVISQDRLKQNKQTKKSLHMTNLDSMLKVRDITLLTNIHIIKGMVFPVDMYGCESWTKKKAEH